jgi:hypothetical protein
VVIVLAIGPKVRIFDDGFLRALKIRIAISFGEKVNPSVPCCTILRNIKDPAEYESDISYAKFTAISLQVPPDSLLGVSAGVCQIDLVDESGVIRIQMGTHSRSENGRSAWDTFYDTAP